MMEGWAALQNWIQSFADNPESLLMAFSMLVGVAILLLLLAGYYLFTGLTDPLRKRVNAVTGKSQPNLKVTRTNSTLDGLIESIGGKLVIKQEAKRRKVETLLVQAGFREEGALNTYLGITLGAMLIAPLVTFGAFLVIPAIPAADAATYALFAFGVGAILPERLLNKLVQRRQTRIRRGMPDAMDLLVICTEAGLGLNGAIARVGKELALSHPDLADELAQFPLQTRAGMDTRAALKDLVDRTGLDEIQSLVALLLQGMRFGSSIGESLRIFATELRTKRLQRAEERAAKIGTLIIFPVVLFIMPSFLLAILGPVVISTLKAL
jgi:tight adherence protein C